MSSYTLARVFFFTDKHSHQLIVESRSLKNLTKKYLAIYTVKFKFIWKDKILKQNIRNI